MLKIPVFKKKEMLAYNRKLSGIVVHHPHLKVEFHTDEKFINIDFWAYPENNPRCEHLSLSSRYSKLENERRYNAICRYIHFGEELPTETQFLL